MLLHEADPGDCRESRYPPLTVRLAKAMQFTVLGLALIAGVSSYAALEPTIDILESAQREVGMTNMSVFRSTLATLKLATYIYVTLVVAYSLLVAWLPFLYTRGSGTIRVVAWILASIGLAGTGLVLGLNEFGYLQLLQTHPGEANAIARAHANTEIWPNTPNIVATAIAALLYLAIIILLAAPKSNRYFMNERP